MAPLRLKVQLGDENSNTRAKPLLRKFVYVFDPSPNKTISDLQQSLQECLIQRFSYSNVKLVQLITHDGFVLFKTDLCSLVLKDNDHIICMDMRRFVNDYYTYNAEGVQWLNQKQFDATTNRDRLLRVGLDNAGALFIRMVGTPEVNSVHVFGFHELAAIADQHPPDKLIGRLDNTMDFEKSATSNWFIQCQWEYDPNTRDALFLICELKIGSSDGPWSAKLQVLLNRSATCVEKGELIILSSGDGSGIELTDEQRQRLKELIDQLPPPKHIGPQIDPTVHSKVKPAKHECEGESLVRIAYGNTNTVLMEQTNSIVAGMCQQHVTITHIIFSKKTTILPEILSQRRSQIADKPISTTNIDLLYQNEEGAWRKCEDIAIAAVRDTDSNWLSDLTINIEPDKLISFSIKGVINFKGVSAKFDNVRTRAHRSLPQPLKLKIVVTDNFSKQCSLIVEQMNKPLDLITAQHLTQSTWRAGDTLAFIFADNCDNDDRHYLYMCVNTQNMLLMRSSNTVSVTFERNALLLMQYTARQAKRAATDLENLSYKDDSGEVRVAMLFDPVSYIAYAVRCEITTPTSKTEETVPIPIEKLA